MKISDIMEQSLQQAKLDDVQLPIGMDKEDLEALIAVLGLPEETFQTTVPLMLEQMRKEVNNPIFIYETLKNMKLEGNTVEDLLNAREDYVKVIESLDEISQIKRDFLIETYDITANALAEAEHLLPVSIPIQLINENAKIPTYARQGDAGMDVYATCDMDIMPGETKLMPLGFKVALPMGYELQVRPKSGLSLKSTLRIANAPGTIDSGYRDECGVILQNCADPITAWGPDNASCLHGGVVHIDKGQKIAQFVLQKVPTALFKQVEDITIFAGDRGGGFGSTGLK